MTIYIQRLYQWAKHIEFGKLAHESFTMGCISMGFREKGTNVPADYETVGCAAGELPAAFPNEWKWRCIFVEGWYIDPYCFSVSLKKWKRKWTFNNGTWISDAMSFFALTSYEVRRICMPESYARLPTRLEVAARIRKVARELGGSQARRDAVKEKKK